MLKFKVSYNSLLHVYNKANVLPTTTPLNLYFTTRACNNPFFRPPQNPPLPSLQCKINFPVASFHYAKLWAAYRQITRRAIAYCLNSVRITRKTAIVSRRPQERSNSKKNALQQDIKTHRLDVFTYYVQQFMLFSVHCDAILQCNNVLLCCMQQAINTTMPLQ